MRQRATFAAEILQGISSFAGRRQPSLSPVIDGHYTSKLEELLIMDYQKEYARLVGQVDRAISILEHYAPGDPIVQKAGELLISALHEAEEHYMQEA